MNAMPDFARSSETLLQALRGKLGHDGVTTDSAELDFFSRDVFAQGEPPLAVIRPATIAQLAESIRLATTAGIAIIARGGGLSYTDGFLAQTPSVLIDMSMLNKIIDINREDMTVTVEAGLYWADLDAALAPLGLRTPYWGPLSGLKSTVGGALSQGSVFLGSGLHGSVGDTVIGLEVVTADGTLIKTGSAAAGNTSNFIRYFGPDLTGVFVGDAGALGVKVRATLRLIPRPALLDFVSFEFPDPASLFKAMSEISRQGLASECFGFDPTLAKIRLQRASLFADAKTLMSVVKQSGLKAGLGLVTAGRNFLEEGAYSGHAIVEDDNAASLADRVARVRAIFAKTGKPTDNSIPKAMRATPFVAPNSMLGPGGERWVPVHGIVPHSKAVSAAAACDAYFAEHHVLIEKHNIQVGTLLCTIAHQAMLIEPVFFWPDSHTSYHKRVVEAGYQAKIGEPADNPEAREAVKKMKREIADLLRDHGATHFQIGKFYTYREGRDAALLAMFDAIKRQLDPNNLMNPGALR
jgi:FAD/FMN-containing dehydrogenase